MGYDRESINLRSSKNLPSPDVFIKRELLKGYELLEQSDGLNKVRLFLDGQREIEGWIPDTLIY